MKLSTRTILIAVVLPLLFSAPANALGPVEGEVGAVYWVSDFSAAGTSASAGAPGFRAELWMVERYGLRAGLYQSDVDLPRVESSSSTAVDFLWRPFSPSENNFIAIGVGWQEMDLATLGLADDTSGARLALESRLGFAGVVYLFAQGSYSPALADSPGIAGGRFEDMSGYDAEIGVTWNFAPFVSLRAAYRIASIDFRHTGTGDGDADSKGFLAGLNFQF